MLVAAALPGIPEVRAGDDLAALIVAAAGLLADGDVLVVAHKVVSKAEGRTLALGEVQPRPRARQLAAEHGKDPRLVEVILAESAEIVRSRPGVLICRTKHGFVCANAGVDASNAGAHGEVVLLPDDPDASARALRGRLRALTGVAPAIVVADSFGRAWRIGQCDVAIGVAGLHAVEDWRGRTDYAGREMHATVIAVADQLAAVADLARAKDAMQPVVVVSGAGRHLLADHGPGAAALVRAQADDLFR